MTKNEYFFSHHTNETNQVFEVWHHITMHAFSSIVLQPPAPAAATPTHLYYSRTERVRYSSACVFRFFRTGGVPPPPPPLPPPPPDWVVTPRVLSCSAPASVWSATFTAIDTAVIDASAAPNRAAAAAIIFACSLVNARASSSDFLRVAAPLACAAARLFAAVLFAAACA